jgi:hypothetical protein
MRGNAIAPGNNQPDVRVQARLACAESNGLITFLGLPTFAPLFTLFRYEQYRWLCDSEMLMCATWL